MKSTFRSRSSAISWSTWAPRRTHRNYERRYDGSDVNVWKDANKQIHNFCLKLKGELRGVFTHPVNACLFLITLRFPSKYVGWLNQGIRSLKTQHYAENACVNGMWELVFTSKLLFSFLSLINLPRLNLCQSPSLFHHLEFLKFLIISDCQRFLY